LTPEGLDRIAGQLPAPARKSLAPGQKTLITLAQDHGRMIPASTARSEHPAGGSLMLVLTRRLGEEIVLADDIRITIVATKGNQVRVGINAPPSVKVYRSEIHNRLTQDQTVSDAAAALLVS
jgi:carbon storage regulator